MGKRKVSDTINISTEGAENDVDGYADDDADLIAKELIPQDKLHEWMWIDCATPSFLAAYGEVRSCVHVHACRLSTRLLRALHDASSIGRIGYGEMAVSTVCVGEGLVWRPLRTEHIGKPFCPEECMKQEAFELEERLPSRKLFHALKW